MAGKPRGVAVREGRNGLYFARWSHAGKRYEVSTGERDRGRALCAAAERYAACLSARPPRVLARPGAAPVGRLLEHVAEWIGEVESSYDPTTIKTWKNYARGLWAPHFGDTLGAIVERAALAGYARVRLESVLRTTVLKELSALKGFLGWLVERGTLAEMPPWPEMPRRAVGVRSGTQRERAVEMSPAQVEAFLAALPERMPRSDYPLRARLTFMFETGLRPATIDALEIGRHWSPGSPVLNISADIDKNRYARPVPLSARALAILAQRAAELLPEDRHPFPKVVSRKHVVAAAKAAGVPGASDYDLRHARATHDLEAGGDLVGVGFGLGHKQATTTSRYAHGSLRAAERIAANRPILGADTGGKAPESVPAEPDS